VVKPGQRCDGVIALPKRRPKPTSFALQALNVLPDDGLLWFAYRKGAAAKASGLSRDSGWTRHQGSRLGTRCARSRSTTAGPACGSGPWRLIKR